MTTTSVRWPRQAEHADLVSDLTDENDSLADSLRPVRRLEISWEALEDAFENNAPEVHSYMHMATGEVLRVVDGVADPAMHQRIAGDGNYLRVDPVSSREQYRWMERYIATVTEPDLRARLMTAIDGKGAFRRFKDVLMAFPADREKWFEFRTERLRSCMEAWLVAHKIEATARPVWSTAPASADEEPAVSGEPTALTPSVSAPVVHAPAPRIANIVGTDHLRRRLREVTELLPASQLHTIVAFAEFLLARAEDAHTEAQDANRDAAPAETVAAEAVQPGASASQNSEG